MGDANGGRIARGWYLMGISLRYLAGCPRLFAFPAISGVLLTVLTIAVFIPVAGATDLSFTLTVAIVATLIAIPATVATVFLNVCFLGMVQAHMRGERPTMGEGFALGRSRLGPIVRWSLLTVLVGAILRGLAALPGGEAIGAVACWLGGLAWALATYFVVPVLVVEEVGAIDSIKRSTRVFKERWGESLTGDLTAGAAFGILMIPGFTLLLAGFAAYEGSPATGITLAAIGVVLTLPLVVLSSAVTEMFQLVIYREVVDGQPPGPFTSADTQAAFHPRKRWFRRS